MSVRTLVAVLLFVVAGACGPTKLVGTELGSQPAPDFTLTDGITGVPLTLSAQRGKVVALAFLYTRCPDVCPLTAEKVRQTQRALGAERDRLLFVAVTVDPEHDTPDAVRAFARDHGLDSGFAYLIGAPAQLGSVWSAYGVRVVPDPSTFVGHTDAIYLIDPQGRERLLVHSDLAIDDLTADVKALASGR